ncbi:MAG: hypothetical protein ACM3ZC_02350 [Bacteroidota bacterium]
MTCLSCQADVVSAGLVFCPKCSARLSRQPKRESRHAVASPYLWR